MTALATPAQLTSRLQQGTLDAAAAQLAVDHGSGLVRAIGRQQYDFVSQETVVLSGGERQLTLPQRPLVVDTGPNLLTVVELGEFGGINVPMVEDRDYSRIGNELTRGYPWWWNSTQRLMGYPRARPLGVWTPRVRVTYSHGYQTVPDDIVSVVLDAAAVLYDNPTQLRSFTIDDYTETKATEVLGAAMVQAIADKLGTTGRRRRAFSIRTG
jgi:hypothetical protein